MLKESYLGLASVAQLDVRPTGDQEDVGSVPNRSGNILSWSWNAFYSHSLPSLKGSCQFLAKEWAQVLVYHWED